MKKIKYWSVFVGLPKWEYWNEQKKLWPNGPDMSFIGQVCVGTQFTSRKKAKEAANRLQNSSIAWNYIVNPSWDQSNGGNK
jgi:hypothetical protein